MKRFLAIALCLAAFTGCSIGSGDDGLKMGGYVYNGESDNSYMPEIVLKDETNFDIIYKGKSFKNMTGTYTIDDDNIIMTVEDEYTDNPDEAKVYTFEISEDNNSIVFRNIGKPLEMLTPNENIVDTPEVPDCAEFVYDNGNEQ